MKIPMLELQFVPIDLDYALKLLGDYPNFLYIDGKNAQICLDDVLAFRRILRFENVALLPNSAKDEQITNRILDVGTCHIEYRGHSASEDGITFLFRVYSAGDLDAGDIPNEYYSAEEVLGKVLLNCSGISLYTEAFRADMPTNWGNPWYMLSDVAEQIAQKPNIGLSHNEKEQALLPLLTDLRCLNRYEYPSDEGLIHLPTLRRLFAEFDETKLLSLLGSLEQTQPYTDRYYRRASKLHNRLCLSSSEPLWRYIREQISDSQRDYPVKADRLCHPEALSAIRTSTQKQMEALGYEGSFPDYVKKGSVHGIHLIESYAANYLTFGTKEAFLYIHCTEEVDDTGNYYFSILCATDLSGKESHCKDVFSCLFNAHGECFWQEVYYNYALLGHHDTADTPSSEQDLTPEHLSMYLRIADKKAQLLPLTKEERALDNNGYAASSLALFLLVPLVIGLLSACFFTPCFMVMEFLVTLCFGKLDIFPEMFLETPWLKYFLFYTIGVAGFMWLYGLYVFFPRRK